MSLLSRLALPLVALAALARAQAAVYPGSVVIPTMSVGATDSAFLRAKGVQAYAPRHGQQPRHRRLSRPRQ